MWADPWRYPNSWLKWSIDWNWFIIETLLNEQRHIAVKCDFLSKKYALLQDLRDDYKSEIEAWETNLEFFKNPLSLSCVEMSDCVFENINDAATLSSINNQVWYCV